MGQLVRGVSWEWGNGGRREGERASSLCVMMMLTLCWYTNANTIKCDKWQHNLLRESRTVSSFFFPGPLAPSVRILAYKGANIYKAERKRERDGK